METLGYLTGDTWKFVAAAASILIYVAFCFGLYRRYRTGGMVFSVASQAAPGLRPTRIIYASQTGQAQSIAEQTARALAASNLPVQLFRLDQDWLAGITTVGRLLFIASTAGEGDSPDHATGFVRRVLQAGARPELRGVHYGLLALGDRSYREFCGFGRKLDQWLQASGAVSDFARIEADRLDAGALAGWHAQVGAMGAGESFELAGDEADYTDWRFLSRVCLNEGSPGAPSYLITLAPASGSAPAWLAGDIIELNTPGGDGRPRSYSISNLCDEGRVELIVRTYLRDDGSLGQASGWLNVHAQPGDTLPARFRSNPAFNLDAEMDVPIILIGSGTGIAGLRAHLKAREKAVAQSGMPAPARCAWLLFGERSGQHDRPCRTEIETWQRKGVLTRLDLVFSRDEPAHPYVQHRLLAHAGELRSWIAQGAAVLICGSARAMSRDVNEVLRSILGDAQVDHLLESGRIRRDVF